MTARNRMMPHIRYGRFEICCFFVCKIPSSLMWFMLASCEQVIQKASNSNSSLNRLGKVLIWKQQKFPWISNGCSYTIKIKYEWFQLWCIKSAYQPIYTRIFGQNHCIILKRALIFSIREYSKRRKSFNFLRKKRWNYQQQTQVLQLHH